MEKPIPSWKEALDTLVRGNQRFMSGVRSTDALLGHVKLKELATKGQKPFAVVLSCSDSRVPAELLFDCGFGDLFVVRVAGNVVQPSQIASIEYAAKLLGVPLCVVMGHSKCGAVQAALDSETGKVTDLGPHIALLVDLIRPAIKNCLSSAGHKEAASVVECCIRENVRLTVREIANQSEMLRELAAQDKFQVVEAVFHLETGEVRFEEPCPNSMRKAM